MNEIKLAAFYEDEYADTKTKILKNTSVDSFNILFMTDMHIDWADEHDGIIRQCHAMVKLTEETDIDCIILGGDVIHGIRQKELYFDIFKEYVDILGKAKIPVLAVHGNHDDNAYHNKNKPAEIEGFSWEHIPTDCMISTVEWSRLLMMPLAKGAAVKDESNADSSYYYVDFEDKQTRIIVLDAYDYVIEENERGYARYSAETWNKLSDRQIEWFVETALDPKKNGWNFIIASHPSLTNTGICAPFRNSDVVCDLLSCFNKKTTYENSDYGIKVDFTENKSHATLSIFGHTHRDYYDYDKKTGMLFLGSGNAKTHWYDCTGSVYEYAFCEKREKGTITEALFDCVICKADGEINKIRFGAGPDQNFKVDTIIK